MRSTSAVARFRSFHAAKTCSDTMSEVISYGRLLAFMLTLCIGLSVDGRATELLNRPNVLLIVSDDLNCRVGSLWGLPGQHTEHRPVGQSWRAVRACLRPVPRLQSLAVFLPQRSPTGIDRDSRQHGRHTNTVSRHRDLAAMPSRSRVVHGRNREDLPCGPVGPSTTGRPPGKLEARRSIRLGLPPQYQAHGGRTSGRPHGAGGQVVSGRYTEFPTHGRRERR